MESQRYMKATGRLSLFRTTCILASIATLLLLNDDLRQGSAFFASGYTCRSQSTNRVGDLHLMQTLPFQISQFSLSSYDSQLCLSASDNNLDTSNITSAINESSNGSIVNKGSNTEWLETNYQYSSVYFAIVSLLMLILPDFRAAKFIPTKLGSAAGYGIASGLSYILAGAARQDRLKSDTYMRLNLGLLGFCLANLPAIPGDAWFLSGFIIPQFIIVPLMTVLRFYGVVLGYAGWKQGVVDNASQYASATTTVKVSRGGLLREFMRGTKATVKGLKVKDKKKSMTYRNILLLVASGIVLSFLDGTFGIRYKEVFHKTAADISLHWSAMGRLFMITTMIFSLKDAAERDRLTGSTFVQLNLMLGTWAFLVGVGQFVRPTGYAFYRGVEMFAVSAPFYIKAYKGMLDKKQFKRQTQS